MVHGGIDGYSRIPVYLHASTNNRADTVLKQFTAAVYEYGLPSRVRCDKGGENYDVGTYMLNHPHRGPGRGSIIAGTVTAKIYHYCDCVQAVPSWFILSFMHICMSCGKFSSFFLQPLATLHHYFLF